MRPRNGSSVRRLNSIPSSVHCWVTVGCGCVVQVGVQCMSDGVDREGWIGGRIEKGEKEGGRIAREGRMFVRIENGERMGGRRYWKERTVG